MKSFVDTSVLVAAGWLEHPRHQPSFSLLLAASKDSWYCSLHTLAELYSTLTALPVRPAIAPEQAAVLVEEAAANLRPVVLTPSLYLQTIRESAVHGARSGLIYDALLLACARKVNANRIYTWNTKHFLRLAPDLADRIRTP